VPLYRRLIEAGTTFMPNTEVDRIDGREVVLRNVYSGEESRIGPIDLAGRLARQPGG
jgi:hypothetical protein